MTMSLFKLEYHFKGDMLVSVMIPDIIHDETIVLYTDGDEDLCVDPHTFQEILNIVHTMGKKGIAMHIDKFDGDGNKIE